MNKTNRDAYSSVRYNMSVRRTKAASAPGRAPVDHHAVGLSSGTPQSLLILEREVEETKLSLRRLQIVTGAPNAQALLDPTPKTKLTNWIELRRSRTCGILELFHDGIRRRRFLTSDQLEHAKTMLEYALAGVQLRNKDPVTSGNYSNASYWAMLLMWECTEPWKLLVQDDEKGNNRRLWDPQEMYDSVKNAFSRQVNLRQVSYIGCDGNLEWSSPPIRGVRIARTQMTRCCGATLTALSATTTRRAEGYMY